MGRTSHGVRPILSSVPSLARGSGPSAAQAKSASTQASQLGPRSSPSTRSPRFKLRDFPKLRHSPSLEPLFRRRWPSNPSPRSRNSCPPVKTIKFAAVQSRLPKYPDIADLIYQHIYKRERSVYLGRRPSTAANSIVLILRPKIPCAQATAPRTKGTPAHPHAHLSQES